MSNAFQMARPRGSDTLECALHTQQPASPTPPAEQPEDEGISREQWIDQAVRVYLIAGDTEDQALECAAYLWGELDMDDLADPYDAAMSDIEGRGPVPQAAPKAAPGELSADSLRHQNKLLAETLGACILASGIVRKDIDGFTGPELLHFGEDLRSMLEAAPQPAPVPLSDAVEHYLEAQDALDNREYGGINAEPYEKLLRRRNASRKDLDAALAAQGGKA